MSESKRKPGCLFKLAVALLPTLLFLAIVEGATRLFWHHEVKADQVGIVLTDPNRSVQVGDIVYRTNSHGIRNAEIPEAKPEGARRILALGDSFTFGTGLSEEELITTKLENLLRPDHPGLEIVNTAYGSANTVDEYQQLLRMDSIYDGDAVIVFFFTNDVLTNRMGSVSWRQRIKEFLRKNSKFFAMVYAQMKKNYAGPAIFLPPDYRDLDDTKPGWVAFIKALLQIRDYCRENDQKLLFVMIPTLTTLNKNYPYAELREKVGAYARSIDITTVDLFDAFSPHPPAELWVSPENTHWNDMATTLAAKEIVDEVEALLRP